MRKLIITVGLIAGWIVIVIAFFIAEEKIRKPPVRRDDISSIENYAVQEFTTAVQNKRLGCAALVILKNGKIVAEHSFGIANNETKATVKTDETIFLLSSLSKAVTAWGVMKLVQDGRLNLDEPVIRHLSRWRFPGSEAYRDKVTARQLLSHTAGFVEGYGHGGFLPDEKLQTIEESLTLPKDANMGTPKAAIISIEPGTAMVYSSAGYAVLQLLIEEITQRSFNDFMTEAVLHPLGMYKSAYDLDTIIAAGREHNLAANYDMDLKTYPHRRYTNLAGVALRSTAHDIALLASAYYNENPVLTKESMKHFSTPQPPTAETWGLGHTLYGKNDSGAFLLGHGGGAFPASGAEMRIDPTTGNAIIITATGTQGLISAIADVWVYWDTGRKVFDIRNVVRKRLVHVSVAIVLGVTIILLYQKRLTRKKSQA